MFASALVLALSAGCGDSPAGEGGSDDLADGGAAAGGESGSGGNIGPGGGSETGGAGGIMVGSNPHPLYPPLDLDTLPGDGGGERGPYTPPDLPSTTQTVSVSTTGGQAGIDLMSACNTPGTEVEVPSAAGDIGVINLGDVDDCDVVLGEDVVIQTLVIGSLPGPTPAPTHRVRIRGGQIGSVFVRYGSTDVVFDGVTVNNGVMPSGQRNGTGFYLNNGDGDDDVVDRFAIVNSFIRMVAVPAGDAIDGTAYLSGRARNLLFANNNIVTSGNRNSWGFRFSGGENILIVDNSVRVSFHKLVRMNDAPVDYVYIKGGTWMREATLSNGGSLNNDSFAQLSGSSTDHVYVHDPVVYLLANTPVSFGATYDAVQDGRSWEARNIAWHTVSTDVMSSERLEEMEGYCAGVGAMCDYGAQTHTYDVDPALAFPNAPWRDLPAIDDDDPDNLPVQP